MKDVVISAMLIAVGVVGLTNVEGIRNIYAGAYAENLLRRDVADRCLATSGGATSGGVGRLDTVDRDGCEVRLQVGAPTVQLLGPPTVPKDDIRRIQALQH